MLGVAVLLSGCLDPNLDPNGYFSCADGDTDCPSGSTCDEIQGRCVPEGEGKDLAVDKPVSDQKVVPDKKLSDQKVVPDKKPADQKVVPDKKLSDQKVVPDKKPADQKVVPDKKPADQKAPPDKVSPKKDGTSTGCTSAGQCDDKLKCTTDSCHKGTCQNKILAGQCVINKTCYKASENQASKPCNTCAPSKSTTTWSTPGRFNLTFGTNKTNEVGNDVVLAPDGDYVMAGTTSSATKGGTDGWITRVAPNAGAIWSKKFGGSFKDSVEGIVALPAGGYIFVGNKGVSATSQKLWVARIDEAGVLKDEGLHTYGANIESVGFAVALGPGGDPLITGYTRLKAGVSETMYALRVNASNLKTKEWEQNLGGASPTRGARGMAVEMVNNNMVIAGTLAEKTGSGITTDGWIVARGLLKGAHVHSAVLGNANQDDFLADMTKVAGGKLVAVGSQLVSGKGGRAWVLKLDPTKWPKSNGVEWDRTYSQSSAGGPGFARSVCELSDGALAIGGIQGATSNSGPPFVLRLYGGGSAIWTNAKVWSRKGAQWDLIRACVGLPDGGILATGDLHHNASTDKSTANDLFLVRLDKTGVYKCP